MALVKDPVAKALRTSTVLQAARLYQQLDVELALNDQLPAGWEAEAERAQGVLRDRFPGQELDHPDNAQGDSGASWGPSLSRRSKQGLSAGDDGDDDDDASGPRSAKPGHQPGHGGRGSTPSGRTGRPRPGARARRRGRSRGARAGRSVLAVPRGTAMSGGQLVATLLGGTLLLVLLYVLLRSADTAAKGRSALDYVSRGLVAGLGSFVAPVDPLAPRSQRAKGAFAQQQRTATALGRPRPKTAPRASVRARSPQRRPTVSPSP